MSSNLRCCECGQWQSSRKDLKAHLSREHLGFFPYECMYCLSRWATDTELIDHIQNAHPTDEQNVVSRYAVNEPRKSQLKLLLHNSILQSVPLPQCNTWVSNPSGTAEEETSSSSKQSHTQSIPFPQFHPNSSVWVPPAQSTVTASATPALQFAPSEVSMGSPIQAVQYETVQCAKCPKVVRPSTAKSHAWVHTGRAFKCSACTFSATYGKKRLVKDHIAAKHDGHAYVLDQRPCLYAKFRNNYNECFPMFMKSK